MENYMKDKNVKKYYEAWASSLTGHWLNKESFYKLVKVCVNHVGRGDLDRKLDTSYLKLSLCDSFQEKYNEESYDELVDKVVALFECLREYEDTKLP